MSDNEQVGLFAEMQRIDTEAPWQHMPRPDEVPQTTVENYVHYAQARIAELYRCMPPSSVHVDDWDALAIVMGSTVPLEDLGLTRDVCKAAIATTVRWLLERKGGAA